MIKQSSLSGVLIVRKNRLPDSKNAAIKPDPTTPHSILPPHKTNMANICSIQLNSAPSEMTPIDQLQTNLHPYTKVLTLVDPRVAASIRMMLT